MFLPIKAILGRRPRKNGTAVVYIQYCYSSDRRILLPTDLGVPPAYWNKRLFRISPSLPKSIGDADALNARLQKMLRSVENIISYALEQQMADPIAFLKKAWHPEFKTAELPAKAKEIEAIDAPAENLDFFGQFDAYIKTKSRKVSPGMLRTYNVVKQRLIDFQKHRRSKITFESFDYDFYESLINYLTYDHIQHRRQTVIRGLKRNSIGTTIKQLRIFLRDRARRKIIPTIDLTDFKIFDEQTDAIYLTVREIRRIYDHDLTDYPELARFRDMFVLGCYTVFGSLITIVSGRRTSGMACFTRNRANLTIGLSFLSGRKPMRSWSTGSTKYPKPQTVN